MLTTKGTARHSRNQSQYPISNRTAKYSISKVAGSRMIVGYSTMQWRLSVKKVREEGREGEPGTVRVSHANK